MKVKYAYIILFLIAAISCYNQTNTSDSKLCYPPFFEKQDSLYYINSDGKDSTLVFALHKSYSFQNICGYFYTFKSFGRHIMEKDVVIGDFNSSKGFIYKVNSSIYILPLESHYSQYPMKLFDFKLNQRDSFEFNGKRIYNERGIISVWYNYTCCLDTVLMMDNDSIYKFRYKDLCNFNKDDNLVIFASEQKGIVGLYVSYFPNNEDEKMLYGTGLLF